MLTSAAPESLDAAAARWLARPAGTARLVDAAGAATD
jgi:hypothetical protein